VEAPAHKSIRAICLLLAASALGGCLERKLKPLNPCLVSGVVADIRVDNIDKVDILFMVDNSGSMREEQASLRKEFPKLIQTLTTGMRPDGSKFSAARDLHLGVVSSDMGLVGIPDIAGCENGFGDDGIMLNTPNREISGCQASYPRFLSYLSGTNDPMQTATDFACIASLGTEGCGYEQQLESVLKALWPSVDIDPKTGNPIEPNRIQFLRDSNGFGALGHGDQENVGFMRNDPTQGLSLLAIILVTDEEDCSSGTTEHFLPAKYLDPSDPRVMQDPNLRCFHNKGNLYPLERYIDGYKHLRPGNENLVIFGAIVGVPPELVETADYAAVNWKKDTERDAFYQRILDDPQMQERPDPTRTPEQGGNLIPSCNVTGRGVAYPPRRIVEVARGFGENGAVFSICQEDLGPAVDAIIALIAERLGTVCLPRPLVRNSGGMVECNVVWELPRAGTGGPMVPTECGGAGFEFLLPVDEDREATTKEGNAVCKVAQMAVLDGQVRPADNGGQMFNEGWYYDDFSAELAEDCRAEMPQRVTFTTRARPPTGTVVKLECLNETQSLAQNRTDVATSIEQPTIGDACESVQRNSQTLRDDDACAVQLANGEMDRAMFCHPRDKVCVLGCDTTADCPAAWVCDDRPQTLADTVKPGRENGSAICVNPTCGDGTE
jgi:hypothetical protein